MSEAGAGETIYLDHQATTPLDERVLDAMLPYLRERYGNASSPHAPGRLAAAGVARAREQIADLLDCHPQEIIFTSGATEANNLAIKGVAMATSGRRGMVTSTIEHPSVLSPLRRLVADGFAVTEVSVDPEGRLDLSAYQAALDADTLLVSVMAANNEIGTLAPIGLISEQAHQHGALMHCDATQLIGKLPFDVNECGADLVSLSGHKFYGPKGVGALYVQRLVSTRLAPLVDGGGHERGLRSGTLNVPGCVGLGAAADIAKASMAAEADAVRALADLLRRRVSAGLPEVLLVGSEEPRLPGNVSLRFPGVDAQDLMLLMPDIAVSTASACSYGAPEPSHVLRAIGLGHDDAQSVLRFGIGRFTTRPEIERAATRVVESVRTLRAMAGSSQREAVR